MAFRQESRVRWAVCHVAVLAYSVATVSAQIFSPLRTFSTASGFSAPLTQAPDGTLYGTSSSGGLGANGTVYKLNPDGTRFATLYSFTNGNDGAGPVAGVDPVRDKTFYAAAQQRRGRE